MRCATEPSRDSCGSPVQGVRMRADKRALSLAATGRTRPRTRARCQLHRRPSASRAALQRSMRDPQRLLGRRQQCKSSQFARPLTNQSNRFSTGPPRSRRPRCGGVLSTTRDRSTAPGHRAITSPWVQKRSVGVLSPAARAPRRAFTRAEPSTQFALSLPLAACSRPSARRVASAAHFPGDARLERVAATLRTRCARAATRARDCASRIAPRGWLRKTAC